MFHKLGLGGGSSVCDHQIFCVCLTDLSLIIPAPGRSRHCSWNPFLSISLLLGRGFACSQPTYARFHLAKIQVLSSHNHPLFTFAAFLFNPHYSQYFHTFLNKSTRQNSPHAEVLLAYLYVLAWRNPWPACVSIPFSNSAGFWVVKDSWHLGKGKSKYLGRISIIHSTYM
jgi:hypothetical protein